MKASFSFLIAVALVITPMLAWGGTKKTNTSHHSDLTVTKNSDKASPAQSSTTSSPHPTAAPVKKAAAKKTVISQGVLNNKAITKPQPAYPPIAK
jgi:hypothetical protein